MSKKQLDSPDLSKKKKLKSDEYQQTSLDSYFKKSSQKTCDKPSTSKDSQNDDYDDESNKPRCSYSYHDKFDDDDEEEDDSRSNSDSRLIEYLNSLENENNKNVNTKINKDNITQKSNSDKELYLHYLENEDSDTINYRLKYPELEDEEDINLKDNLKFLTGQIESKPDGDLIINIIKNWWGNYGLLEKHHGYIQWLFPIRTQGLNNCSQPLQLHELKELKSKKYRKLVRKHLFASYRMMLDFYGIKLKNIKSTNLERADNYIERFQNLKAHPHNNARITRILKCLGEFEMETYKTNLLEFLINEVFVTKELLPLAGSLTKFWIHTIRNDKLRNKLIEKTRLLIEENL